MSLDLGQDRYARHLWWRASGRIQGGEEYEEDAAPFAVERHDDRWLWTDADGALRAVGDDVRDLVASKGGLVRERSPRGFTGHDGVALLRRLEAFTDESLSTMEVAGSAEIEIAGRTARLFRLAYADGEISLGVDEETGIWTYLQVEDLTITVDTLTTVTPSAHPAFTLLDVVPDLSLSEHREPVHEALEPVLRAVQEATGLRAEVIHQEPRSTEFEFVLLDADGQQVGRVLRQRLVYLLSPAIFGGSQDQVTGPEYQMHVDTTLTDPRAASRIMHALLKAVPDD